MTISKINWTSWSSVSKFNWVAKASISKVNGQSAATSNWLLTSLQAYYDMGWAAWSGETSLTWSYNLTKTWTVPSQTGKNWNARGAFATSSDYLSTSSWPTFSASTAASISCWIYFPSTPGNYETGISIWGTNSWDFKIDVRIDNASHFQLNMEKNQIAWYQATWWSTFSTWQRYNVIITYDWANNGKLYVNWWAAVSWTFSATGTTSDSDIAIWGTLYDGWGWFVTNSAAHMYVDEVAIWNRVLDATDVANLYNWWTWLFYASFN